MKNSECQQGDLISYSCARFLCFRCVAVSRTSRSKKPFEKCFKSEGICFVTTGRKKNQEDARRFCELWPQKSVLPTLSNYGRGLMFDIFIEEAINVTNNEPVWLDILRKAIGSSDSLMVRNRNILTQNRN